MREGAYRLRAKIDVAADYDQTHLNGQSEIAVVIEVDKRGQVVRKHEWRTDGKQKNPNVWRSATMAAGKETAG